MYKASQLCMDLIYSYIKYPRGQAFEMFETIRFVLCGYL